MCTVHLILAICRNEQVATSFSGRGFFCCLHGTYNTRMTSGVYALYNMETNMLYVGCSSHLEERVERHFHQLELNSHPNRLLQKAYRIHPDKFAAITLEHTAPDDKYIREQVWFDRMVRFHEMYNLDLKPLASTPTPIEKQQDNN